MSASNAGPGGVRNLRAMFENKANDQSNSPPSRGRSPNGSVSDLQDRPPSKVRANFVAVEKPSEEGQSQQTPRKRSDVTMSDVNEQTIAEEQGLGEILKGSPFVDDGKFPAELVQESDTTGVADRAAAMVKKMQQADTEPPPTSSVETDAPIKPHLHGHGPVRHKPNQTTGSGPSQTGNEGQPPTPKGPIVKPRGGPEKIKGVMESAANAQKEREAAAYQGDQNEEASKPQPAPEPAGKAKNGVPTLAGGIRPRGGGAKIQGVMESARQAREARATAAAKTAPQTDSSKDAPRSSTTSKTPRSSLPSRRLPAAATAPTAASVAKTDESKPTDAKSVEKKALKVPPRVANVTTASSLAKKSSRASLNSNDGAKAKSSTRPADDGFLARMMRPTASSAQKAHDKVQVHSPPRPKQASGKNLASKPPRRSMSQASENRENETETEIPAVPALPAETEEKVESTES